MKRFYVLAIAIVAVIGLALFATPASAVHKGAGGLACGACHTMHNSQGSATLDGGSAVAFLLRSAATTPHGFCLMCHATAGTQGAVVQSPGNAVAPKVLTSEAWVVNTAAGFTTIGAGGDFTGAGGACVNTSPDFACADTAIALGRGHSLGAVNPFPPGGDAAMGASVQLTCTSCHDPHGTDLDTNTAINRFRNLRFTPVGSGTINAGLNRDLNADTGVAANAEYTMSWKGSTKGTWATAGNFPYSVVVVGAAGVWPVSDATATNSTNSNQYTATGANSSGRGISAFCSTCHDSWHETVATGNISGFDWTRHPVDYIVNSADTSGSNVATIDFFNYTSTTPLLNRLPMAHGDGWQSTAQAYMSATNNQDKVFCLTCHFAHGGPYFDILRWDYLSAVSGGGQTANAVLSTVGCQQCHNR